MSGPEYAARLVETERELWALREQLERLASEWERRRTRTHLTCAQDLRALLARVRAPDGSREG